MLLMPDELESKLLSIAFLFEVSTFSIRVRGLVDPDLLCYTVLIVSSYDPAARVLDRI